MAQRVNFYVKYGYFDADKPPPALEDLNGKTLVAEGSSRHQPADAGTHDGHARDRARGGRPRHRPGGASWLARAATWRSPAPWPATFPPPPEPPRPASGNDGSWVRRS